MPRKAGALVAAAEKACGRESAEERAGQRRQTGDSWPRTGKVQAEAEEGELDLTKASVFSVLAGAWVVCGPGSRRAGGPPGQQLQGWRRAWDPEGG